MFTRSGIQYVNEESLNLSLLLKLTQFPVVTNASCFEVQTRERRNKSQFISGTIVYLFVRDRLLRRVHNKLVKTKLKVTRYSKNASLTAGVFCFGLGTSLG